MLLTLLQSGGAGPGGITGNLAATESGADGAALVGVVLVQGTVAGQEVGSDTLASAGRVLASGSLAALEVGSDTAAASGSILARGLLAATESGADIFTAPGAVGVRGAIAAQEPTSDALASFGSVLARGNLAATESGSDSLASSGEVGYGAPPSAIWAYQLSNGLSAGQTLVELHAMVRELYQLHGLELGSPLSVSSSQRAVASILQSIGELAGTVTVTRH